MIDLLRAGTPALASLLSDELMATLLKLGKTVRYRDGQLVHQRGDAKPGLSIVQSGQVVAGNVGADGSLLMTSAINVGDCFGEFTLFAALPRTHDIYSQGESEVCQIPKAKFMKFFAEHPELAEALLTLTLRRHHALLEYLDSLRRQPLIVRTAQLLLSNVRGAGERYEIACRQDQLAFSLGVSRVSTGKVLSQLQADGLIQLGYGKIMIPSTSDLRDWLQEKNLLAPLKAQ
jgi:CRP-like cAMP-binding protein